MKASAIHRSQSRCGTSSGRNLESLRDSLVLEQTTGPGLAWIAFPAPWTALVMGSTYHGHAAALLRLPNNTLWFASLKGQVWTSRRLQVLAMEVAALASTTAAGALQTALRQRLELPSLVIAQTDPDIESSRTWEVDATLQSRLRNAVQRLLASADPVAIKLSSECGLQAPVYNFLAEEGVQRNRQQFAEVFPILLWWVCCNPQDPMVRNITAAIDAGVQLVKFIAKQAGVSPSAVRCLRGVPRDWPGPRWQGCPLDLLHELDHVPADHRPHGSANEWQEFNLAVDERDRAFRDYNDMDALAREWTRRRMQEAATAGNAGRRPQPLDRAVVDSIRSLRNALVRTIAHELGARADTTGPARSAGALEAADEFLAATPFARAGTLATQLELALEEARDTIGGEADFAAGHRFWPLIARDFDCPEHGLRVIALTTRAEFRATGRALHVCLATPLAVRYELASRRQDTFLVAMIDVATGLTVSAAEIRACASSRREAIGLSVVQHRGAENSEPGQRCEAAMFDLMTYLRTLSAQAHLWRGRECLAQAQEQLRTRFDWWEHQASLRAFRQTLGENMFDSLVQRAGRAR